MTTQRSSILLVLATLAVALASAIPAPPLTVPAPTTLSNSTARIVAQIAFSDDTVSTDWAEVELFQAANPNLVSYTVGANTGEGVTTGGNRLVTVTAGPAKFRTIDWPLTITSAGNGLLPVTTVGNTVRFNNLASGVTAGTNNVPAVFMVGAAAPSPSPSP